MQCPINFGSFKSVTIQNWVNTCLNIYLDNGILFQIGNFVMAFKTNDGRIFLSEKYSDYPRSRIARFRNDILYETIKETRRRIDIGEYTLVNFNGDFNGNI